MTNVDWIDKLKTEEAGETLSFLCIKAKTQQGREEVERGLTYETVSRLICDASPKVRKNTYRILGLLKNEKYLPLLQAALKSEETLFTIPSLLLSLGALGDEDTLREYTPPVSENDTMDKHVAEITIARKKALQSLNKPETLEYCRLDKLTTLQCYAPEGFNSILGEELRSLGFAVVQEKDCCRIATTDLSLLFRAKCLTEALIPIKRNVPLNAMSIIKALPEMPAEAYRIELRGYTKDRRKLINTLSDLLGGENNPSSYVWELRIDCREEVADLFWKPFHVEEKRFPWRKSVLPASMHPALASCLAIYAKKLTKAAEPSVLDPFCGCGSLLFSIESVLHCKRLMGVDKSSTAVEAARSNAVAGKSKAYFITKDTLRFSSDNGFDIILSNMPFGLRVGNHDYNKELYSKFLRKLPSLMNPDGIAILYTMEYKLLQSCIRGTKGIKLREKVRTEAGGLLPWIFVIDKE